MTRNLTDMLYENCGRFREAWMTNRLPKRPTVAEERELRRMGDEARAKFKASVKETE